MGRKEQFTFDDMGNDRDSTPFPDNRHRKGIFVSRGMIVVYVLLSILLAVLIGLIVNFARPCKKLECDCSQYVCTSSSTPSTQEMTSRSDITTTKSTPMTTPEVGIDDDVFWAQCVNMSWERQQCFSGAFPCPKESASLYYRLPETFQPVHYKIEIQPDIYQPSYLNFSYKGSVDISLTCRKASDVIFVHFRDMTINDSAVSVKTDSGSIIGINFTSIDVEQEFFKIHLARNVAVDENVVVSLFYEGAIDQYVMSGMYYSDYTVGNQTKYMLATQLEATDARKAFPCLDEPAMKATFEVTLWRKEPMVALTNMPCVNSTDKGDGWIVDYFGTTAVVMPTYLIAFAIADYTYIEGVANNSLTSKHLRHWSRPDFIDQGFIDYSLEVSIIMFDYFETYFNFTYDMPKEDQISISDFDAGAMENWGLITYRDSRMVWDPHHSTLYEKQRMTGTLAHELLHQWLGNVVTCAWWSDLWLQEGMARFHQHLAMRDAQPDWDVDQIFAAQVIYRAMQYDQTGQSHPIHTIVNSPDEIDTMFSPITYDKAGCVIRMMKELVLTESYRDAMLAYLNEHAYDVANFKDLLSAWDKQNVKDHIKMDSNMTMVMLTWILQLGYPMVTIERLNDDTVRMSQNIFLENPERPPTEIFPAPFGYQWYIPVTYVTSHQTTNMTIEWLNMEPFREAKLPDSLGGSDDWLLGNYKQFGFYKVNYDTNNWNALAAQLTNDHTVFDVVNRGQLLSDSFYLGKAGHIDHVINLKLTNYISAETDYLPWHVTADVSFAYFTKIFRYHADYTMFREFGRNIMQTNYEKLGWDEKPTDTHHDIYLRDLILTHSCKFGNSDCINKAKEYFQMWQNDPQNATIIRPDVRDAVYCISLQHGLVDDWEFFFEQYQNFEHFSLEKSRRRRALTCTDDRPTLTRLFSWAAEGSDLIVSHDPSGPATIMRDISRTPIGQYVAWEYLNNQWDTIPNRFTTLSALTESFSSDYDLTKYDNFVANHPAMSETEQYHYEDIRIMIEHNNRWRHANMAAMFDWLRDVTGNILK